MEGKKMDLIRKLHVRTGELARGQTMTEYALILAAVAVVVFAGYQTMGTTINSLLTSVDGQL
jgi:Flp pilus assembly pilin Flp